jgi:hypothetical protein
MHFHSKYVKDDSGRPERQEQENSAAPGQNDDYQQRQETVDGVGGTIAVIGHSSSVVAPGPSQSQGDGSAGRRMTFRQHEVWEDNSDSDSGIDGFIVATPNPARPTRFGSGPSLQHVQRMLEQLLHGPRVVLSQPPIIPLPPARRPILTSNDLRHRIQPGRLASRRGMSRMDPCQSSGRDATRDIEDDEDEPARKRVRFT